MNINYQRFEATIDGWKLCNGTTKELWDALQKLEEQENKLDRRQESKPTCPRCGKETEPDTAHTCWPGRQEAKPRAIERASEALSYLSDHERPPEGQREFNSEDLLDIADELRAIHAALPPDQSARIAELEQNYTELAQFDNMRLQRLQADRDALVARLEHAVELLCEYENAIQNAGWTRHQQAELDDCKMAITESEELLARIKPD